MRILAHSMATNLILVLLTVGLVYDASSYFLFVRRLRRGKGFSPLPPLLPFLCLGPAVMAKPTILFGIAEPEPLRLLVGFLEGALIAGLSFAFGAFVPYRLAKLRVESVR